MIPSCTISTPGFIEATVLAKKTPDCAISASKASSTLNEGVWGGACNLRGGTCASGVYFAQPDHSRRAAFFNMLSCWSVTARLNIIGRLFRTARTLPTHSSYNIEIGGKGGSATKCFLNHVPTTMTTRVLFTPLCERRRAASLRESTLVV